MDQRGLVSALLIVGGRAAAYDVMNLCASWYPELIVDGGSLSPPSSLVLVFAT